MIIHSFLNKCNTIIENSKNNSGLNPIIELNGGEIVTRALLYFDINKIKKEINNNIDITLTKHILKMTNCGSINSSNNVKNNEYVQKKRASSFDVILFILPYEWDEGNGFDYQEDYAKESYKQISKDGSTWYKAKNNVSWEDEGIYKREFILEEYNKFINGENSIIVGTQHFDKGNENLEIDITNYVNSLLLNENKNLGLCLSFLPNYETIEDNNYVAFFSNHTNTFFVPYVETFIENTILDDRANFYLNKNNKLYFYVSENGEYLNLDEMPMCIIDEEIYPVKQSQKGIYYTELNLTEKKIEPYSILTDVWCNLYLNGVKLENIEMEFVALPLKDNMNLGMYKNNKINFTPQLSGINDREIIKVGDIREIVVDFIENFSYGKKKTPFLSEFKVYTKEGDREIEIFPYQKIDRKFDEYSFIIDTNNFIPNNYYIDIKVKQGKEIKFFTNVLNFKISNDVTELKK